MSKQPPPAPTTSAVGPCPTVIQIVGRSGTGNLPSLMVGAVGAGGYCSDIFFLSLIIFFLPLSGMNGWVTCGLSPFQQNFSDIRTLGG